MKQLLWAAAFFASPVLAEESAFVHFKALKPAFSIKMAEAALEHCQNRGYQIGVMVTDRFGIPQVFIRDRFAGIHVFENTRRKAWTAVSFRQPTSELISITAPNEDLAGLRHLTEVMILGGGLPVFDGEGSVIAGIGVSGAPGGDQDEQCAAAGINAIEDDIVF